MILDKINAWAQTDAGKKPWVMGLADIGYAVCGTFLGVMDRQTAASYCQTGLQQLLFSEETKAAIRAEVKKIAKGEK